MWESTFLNSLDFKILEDQKFSQIRLEIIYIYHHNNYDLKLFSHIYTCTVLN